MRTRNAAPPVASTEDDAHRAPALPARFEESLRERLALLQADLVHQPDYPLLLGRIVECCLSLSLLKRETDPDQGQRWIEQARMYQRALRGSGVPAWAELEQRINNPDRLGWGASALPPSHFREPGAAGAAPLTPTPTAMPMMTTFPGGPGSPPSGRPRPPVFPSMEMAAPPSSGPASIPPGPSFSAGVSRGPGAIPGGYPGGMVMSGGPAYPGAGGYPRGIATPGGAAYPGAGGYPSSLPGAQGPPPPVGRGPGQNFRRPPAPISLENRAASLRKELRAHPSDLDLTWELAEALEGLGRDESLSEAVRRSRNKEAVALYLQAGRRSRTRVQRGTFLSAAARVWETAHEDQRSYDLLKQALKEIPYSSVLWQRMRDVSLRLGKLDESERATGMVQRWNLPQATL